MDLRILIVLSPLLIAAGWAGYNIIRYAIQQWVAFQEKKNA